MSKTELPDHRDKLGRLLQIGDFVAYPNHNSLGFGKIVKLNPKMIGIVPAISKRPVRSHSLKYPDDLVRLAAEDMTWYILKNTS